MQTGVGQSGLPK